MSGMRKTIASLVVAFVVLAPVRGGAWGFDAHRFVMDRAIGLLPEPLRALFEHHRAMAVERSIDPDTWIAAGFENEAPHHFLDLDWEGYGKYPFAELPHDLTAAIAKFGRDRVEDNGTVPWRAEEFFGNLRRAFEAYERRGKFGQVNIILFSSSLAHYVSDAHVPFHSVLNYDGQLSNQHGIHARFESIMFERYRERLTIAPKPARAISNPREYLFEVLKEGTQLVPPILESDVEALGGRDVYDRAYYDRFFAVNRPVMERRLNEAITAVAGMIIGAWEAAGKPPLPLNPPEQPQRKRKS
jgi:hypothetical protein